MHAKDLLRVAKVEASAVPAESAQHLALVVGWPKGQRSLLHAFPAAHAEGLARKRASEELVPALPEADRAHLVPAVVTVTGTCDAREVVPNTKVRGEVAIQMLPMLRDTRTLHHRWPQLRPDDVRRVLAQVAEATLAMERGGLAHGRRLCPQHVLLQEPLHAWLPNVVPHDTPGAQPARDGWVSLLEALLKFDPCGMPWLDRLRLSRDRPGPEAFGKYQRRRSRLHKGIRVDLRHNRTKLIPSRNNNK